MKYIGEFVSIDDKKYRVEINTEKGSGTQEIKLSGSPFVTEMSVDDKQIYAPIKGSSATIEVVTDDFIFDFYTENPIGTSVKLYDATSVEQVVWSGYVTPQMFSQGFKLGLQSIEIDAVDSLSVLEGLQFKSENKEVLSFEDLLRKILKQVNIRYMYVSDNVQLNSATGTETILDKLFISEMNFFDEKSDTESDDDVCWNCLDVISEICQYLGYVATMYGEDLYLLDYDAIKAGNGRYYRYDLINGGVASITFSDSHKIVGEDHYSSDATVNLDKIYNKVSVKADTFTIDDYTSEAATNITNTDGSNFSSSYFELMGIPITDYIWGEVFPGDEDPTKAMDVWIDAHNDAGGGNTGGKHSYYDFVAMKFIKKPNSKHYIYDESWNDISSRFENVMSYPDIKDNNGGIAIKYFTKNLEKTKGSSSIGSKFQEYYKEAKNNPNTDSSKYLDFCLAKGGINSISWTEALLLHNKDAQARPAESEWYKYPFYEIECEGSIIQGGDHSAIMIQGQFYWSCVDDVYPMEYKDFKLDKQNWINPNVDMFVPASVQWGNLWWNGEDWQTTKCGFKLNWLSKQYRDDENSIGKKNTIEEWKCQKTVMQAQPLTNTVDWRFGTSEEGCLITVPKDQNLTGKPKLTIYRPVSGRVWKSRKDYFNGDNNGKLAGDYSIKNGVRWPWFVVALIGLKFKAIMGDQSYDGVNDSDTIYTNVLENDSIEELSTIDFKVHTFDDKENSFGSVGLSGGSAFVNKLYNKALASAERTWYDWEGNLATNGMRQEEHLIYKLVNQYTTPSRVLEFNLKIDVTKPYGLYTDTTVSGNYIVSSFGTDYRMANSTIKLVEKK